MFYLINLLAVPLYYALIRLVIKNKASSLSIFFVVVTIHAILFRALANPNNFVDADTYTTAFEYLRYVSFTDAVFSPYSSWGIGFVVLSWLIGKVSSDVVLLYATIAFLSVGGILLFYKKTTYGLLTSVMMFLLYPMLYYMGFGVLRQHLSIPFMLFALYYIDNKKISIPLSFISILLHTGSIIFVPFYFIIGFYRKYSLKTSCFFSIVAIIVLKNAILFVLSFFPRYEATYFEKEATNNIVPVLLIGVLLLFIYGSNIGTIIKRTNRRDDNILLFLLYGFFVSILSIGMPAAGRLSLPFVYLLPVAMTYLFRYKRKSVDYYQLYLVVFLTITLWQYYLKYEAGLLSLYTYSFYWETPLLNN